jgi:hypothetical protein
MGTLGSFIRAFATRPSVTDWIRETTRVAGGHVASTACGACAIEANPHPNPLPWGEGETSSFATRPSFADWIREMTRVAGAGATSPPLCSGPAPVGRTGSRLALMRARPRAWPRARCGSPRRATSSLGYCGSFARRGRKLRGTRALRNATKFRGLDPRNDSRCGSRSGVRDQARRRGPLAEPRAVAPKAQIANGAEAT